jgi:hypothetical protein
MIAPVSAFHMFWRGAYNQLGHSLMEPITLPFGESLVRGLTGQSKLGRAVSTGQTAMALPEWLYWEDPNEVVDDAEAFDAWAKRVAPWWLGARPRTISRRKTFAEYERHLAKTGKAQEWEVYTLPALTTMDALYMLAVGAQLGMAGVSEEVELSPDAVEQTMEQLTEKLGPVFQFVAESALNMRYEGRKGIPLRDGELEVLDILDSFGGPFEGFRDAVTTADEDGRRYMTPELKSGIALMLRTLPAVGTEIPPWLAAYNNDRWNLGAQAGALRMLQQVSNLGKVYSINPADIHDKELRRVASDMVGRKKAAEQVGTGELRSSMVGER